MENLNVYLAGVGGQGIGLLTEVIMRAADHAGLKVKGVDTHGLAQRGGVVISQLRIGDKVFSPLIPQGEADVVIALERHEALRAMNGFLKDGGTLVYYNTVWQPLEVRLNKTPEVTEVTISDECRRRRIKEVKAFKQGLKDSRMQNTVVLAALDHHRIIPGIKTDQYLRAMGDLMEGHKLESNIEIFTNNGKFHPNSKGPGR